MLKMISGILGVFSCVTDSGPPDRITPLGFNKDIFSDAMSHGSISEYTPSSLTLLAINCVYWDPKSNTKIVSKSDLDKELLLAYKSNNDMINQLTQYKIEKYKKN